MRYFAYIAFRIIFGVSVYLRTILGDTLVLKKAIPNVYKQNAVFYTDQYEGYPGIIPAIQYRAITKHFRRTHHIERLNRTLRQHLSRLVKATLSFSKKLSNHIGAIRYFSCHYNLMLAAKFASQNADN